MAFQPVQYVIMDGGEEEVPDFQLSKAIRGSQAQLEELGGSASTVTARSMSQKSVKSTKSMRSTKAARRSVHTLSAVLARGVCERRWS